MEKKQGIGFFERYLTVWVALCIVIGIAIGQWLPAIPQTLSKFEYANVSIPVAILIWLMIYPMMLKVDFQSVKNVGKRPKGIVITCVTNWVIKPFTMFGIAYLFFYVIFKSLIPVGLAEEYLAGAVLLGAAPCTAMVFVWSHLSLHIGTSRSQRFNHIDCFRSYRGIFVGCRWRFYPVGHVDTLSCTVCCHSAFCRNSDPYNSYPAQRNRLFQYRLCPQVR